MLSRKLRIETKLQAVFAPEHLDVFDESFMHHVPEGSESHFKIVCVSTHFIDKTLVARHRAVNAELKEEFTNGLHALSVHAFTPQEWSAKQNVMPSPKCHGGQLRESSQKSK